MAARSVRYTMAVKFLGIARMLFWLTLAVATAWLLWYMVTIPGTSYSGPLKPLAAEQRLLADKINIRSSRR